MVDFGIGSIGPNELASQSLAGPRKPSQPATGSFGQWLSKSINEVNNLQEQSSAAALKLATGENKDIHGTMIKMQKTEIATSLMLEVRNKLLSAYDEIKRMQF